VRLSVIIPTLDERDLIGVAIDRVRAGDPWEIIVADGQSADGTADAAEAHGARVVISAPGRGRQMNAGAAVATGDVLLFLHADTALPPEFTRHVAQAMARPNVVAGAFELGIDAPHRALRLVEAVANLRSRLLGLPYGDQAIFMPVPMFRRIAGYPEADAMEDFAMVRRVRWRGRIVIVPARVSTSARRWLAGGIGRTAILNQVCVAAWLLGVSGHRIASWRKHPASRLPLLDRHKLEIAGVDRVSGDVNGR